MKHVSNNKSWPTKSLKNLLYKDKRIFSTLMPLTKRSVYRKVRDAINRAKRENKDKRESRYYVGDLRHAWKGIKSMASVNQKTDFPQKLLAE